MTAIYGPYTPVRRAGNLLFVSGQVGVDPASRRAPTDVAVQTTQALQNMENVLRDSGASLQNVVKTTVYLTNMDDFAQVNEAYERAFASPRPTRSTVAVRELPRVGGETPILVEIEAIAYKEAA